jgi:hypothetical protein
MLLAPQTLGDRERLRATCDAELSIDVPQMGVDGRQSDAQSLRGRGRGSARGEFVDDLPFPRREGFGN